MQQAISHDFCVAAFPYDDGDSISTFLLPIFLSKFFPPIEIPSLSIFGIHVPLVNMVSFNRLTATKNRINPGMYPISAFFAGMCDKPPNSPLLLGG